MNRRFETDVDSNEISNCQIPENRALSMGRFPRGPSWRSCQATIVEQHGLRYAGFASGRPALLAVYGLNDLLRLLQSLVHEFCDEKGSNIYAKSLVSDTFMPPHPVCNPSSWAAFVSLE